MGLSNELSCEAGSFTHCHNPHRFFHSEVLRFYFPMLEPWVARSVLFPSFSSQFMHSKCGTTQPLPCLESFPPGCPSLPLLPVCMNVSSLTPWLLDFHAVQFSGNSGCFLFLNLLLSFFWLCKEAQCTDLHLHLGRKSSVQSF